MSNRIQIAHRRLLPLTVAAYLLAAAAQPPAGDSHAGTSSQSGLRVAGVHVALGYHGHHGHRGLYGGHHRYYRPHYYGHFYPFYYPRFYYHGYYGTSRYASRHFGGLDLNVKPKKTTQVYVDGNYVGLTGQFDGWPEYLWLEASRRAPSGGTNTYELILYNPGYRTVVRQVEIQPGVVIKIKEDMQPGESIPPEELTRAKAPRPEPAPRYPERATPERAPAPEPGERAAPSARQAPAPAPRSDVLDARQHPARLKLSVAPADASVYLDGHFIGIAGEIGEQRSGILIDPGDHRLEIVRPGYTGRELSFEAKPGGEIELEIELQPGAARTGASA